MFVVRGILATESDIMMGSSLVLGECLMQL